MAKESSFDIVSTVDMQEVDNAFQQARKELAQRYDLKDSAPRSPWTKRRHLTVTAPADFVASQVIDVIGSKLIKRGIDLTAVKWGDSTPSSGGGVRRCATVVNGIDKETAGKINKDIKAQKLKCKVTIEGDKLRVSSPSRDTLQEVIAFLRGQDYGSRCSTSTIARTSDVIDTTRDSAAPSVCLITMGCAKNEVDSAAMARRLREAGFSVTEEASSADAIIVNTCSFIQAATEESIDAIFEAASLPKVDEGSAVLIVAGCMPARYGDDLAAELTEASAFVPCSREDDIAEVVARALRISLPVAAVGGEPAEGEGRTFAYVKISDGCDRFCSYCTIPYIRGRYHSFPYEQIAEDVEREIASGAREIMLIAQDTGRWGADLPDGRDLAWLVDTLAEAHPDTWFRIMYLQPEGATDELLSVMAARENVCSYLDIPLQHVSKPILRAMNRRGDAAAFRALIERIEAAVPDITLRTTLIAGFPGETDE